MFARKRLLVVAGVLAAVGAIAGIAIAQIPYSGVITGCYTKSGGGLRVIDAQSTNCTTKETRLDWNQQGVPGKDGINGTNGADGADGVDGAPGTASAAIRKSQYTISARGGAKAIASCLPNEVAPSGGYYVGPGNVTASYPWSNSAGAGSQINSQPNAWALEVGNPTDGSIVVDVYVVCA